MTALNEALRLAEEKLRENSVDNAENECRYIFMKVLNITYTDFLFNNIREIGDDELKLISDMLESRIKGMPIQYVIGEWDFMDCTFEVGPGVLIPRPETEELCSLGIKEAQKRENPLVYDLCSGSGCIGISIKKAVESSRVFLVEKSEKALTYLKNNTKEILGENFNGVIQGDILDFGSFSHLTDIDIIISNPPYIKSSEIPSLQKEVQKEPLMALDGGEDGLIFYRALSEFWAGKLKADGVMLLECGEEQAEEIASLFITKGFAAEIKKDFADVQRMVIVRRNNNDT